jgi:hypothetical protein
MDGIPLATAIYPPVRIPVRIAAVISIAAQKTFRRFLPTGFLSLLIHDTFDDKGILFPLPSLFSTIYSRQSIGEIPSCLARRDEGRFQNLFFKSVFSIISPREFISQSSLMVLKSPQGRPFLCYP